MILTRDEWLRREDAHRERADGLTASHRDRVARGEKHPVWDFLFTYYGYKPAQLRRWHPGAGVELADASERVTWRWYSPGMSPGGAIPDAQRFAAEKPELARLVSLMLRRTGSRPGQFGCFGLHEWAMVYGLAPGEQRHESLPLRLTQAETDAVVETSTIRCSHFDAFRFFTDGARPLNTLAPTRETQVANEQPGCLHATMDLYKWATKLGPAVPGSLLVDTFRLARRARELDMRASPYDVSGLGYDAVPIETPEGRTAYVTAQRELVADAEGVRARLVGLCAELEQVSTRLACPHPGPEPPSTRGE